MIRDILAWTLLFAGGFLLLSDVVRLQITGLALAAVALFIVSLWMLGVFRADFWGSPITQDHPDYRQGQDQ